jgi:electron transfer flavoprotein alpha/beta subunit
MTNLIDTRYLVPRKQGAITVVNVGGPDTEPTLRKVIGANEAIRVNATLLMVL